MAASRCACGVSDSIGSASTSRNRSGADEQADRLPPLVELLLGRRVGLDRLDRLLPVADQRVHLPSHTTSAQPVRYSPSSRHSTRWVPPGEATVTSRAAPP
ncbi:MAG: hypothetical protein MZV64_73545 [Ignavibacteriales bacterium]|nr:hypothetical protein [Ignavibacteriales bacterium]